MGTPEINSKNPTPSRDSGEALLQIGLAINSHLDLQQIFDKVIFYTRELVGCKDASVVLWDPREALFKAGASTNIGATVSQRVRREKGATRWVVDHGQPVLVPDTRQDPFVANPMLPEYGVLAYAGVPIKQVNEVLGVLYALFDHVHTATPEELKILDQLASMAAIAINNAGLLHSLKELNTFKSSMIRMLAHDLRNPILVLGMSLQFLKDAPNSSADDRAELLAMTDQSLERMKTLVEGVLRYEKLHAAGIEKRPCDLNTVAGEILAHFTSMAAQKSIVLLPELSPQPVLVLGDKFLLGEAVANLISNAIQFTPPGGRVLVRTKSDGEENQLEVQDSGPGLSPEDQQKLFQPFVRLRPTSADSGSGLGLSLTRTIVERHGGSISVNSAPGQGATFSIHLPPFAQ